jgi:hypothetical protein
MNDALALSRGFAVPDFAEMLKSIGEQFAFLRAPSKKSAKQLSSSSEEMVKNICDILDRMAVGAIEKRTADEFIAYRNAQFPNYVRAMRAISDFARLVIPQEVLTQLAANSFLELEADFRDHGDAFGSVVRDQAIFTVWTFKKIDILIRKILSNIENIPDGHKKTDDELALKFGAHVLWTRFHLDCLITSLRTENPIYPVVRDVIAEGLRAAVNAYACVKQGVELRLPHSEPAIESAEWDDEDQALLDSSMRDMEREISD